jgi:YVTN family beta-propeller protein
VTPTNGPNTKLEAPFIDVNGFADAKADPRNNSNNALVYPTGLAISADGDTLYVANNLGDSLGIIRNLHGEHRLEHIRLAGQTNAPSSPEHFIYPYGVVAVTTERKNASGPIAAAKVYVSCWNDASIAVVDAASGARHVAYIPVARHPTKMLFDSARARLYVVNSNADSISVIDTTRDLEVERINVRLSETGLLGGSPEGLALSADGRTLYVANAHSNSVAVVSLAERNEQPTNEARSRVRGFIPTGQYPSAVAIVGHTLFVANGKGTGVENSSLVVNNSGRVPNMPNDRFPAGGNRAGGLGGEYSLAIVVGNISVLDEPDERQLARYTQQVLRNDGLLDEPRAHLFRGPVPFKHVIYVIKENRTYDQVFGDLANAGDGTRADGDPSLAIFGAGAAARRPEGPPQNITPNAHALALRFGLLDRFFTNAEISADGHNWSTAAFSSDYTDKVLRWNGASRGRSYDFEGFNRLPDYRPTRDVPPILPVPVTHEDLANFVRRFIPYLHGARDAAEPETLYLWDAAARAGLTYRNYGEFIGTESEYFIRAVNADKRRTYPDISPTAFAVPTKRSLEGHHSLTYRNFDQYTPDSMTAESYRAAKESNGAIDPLISDTNQTERFRGYSRINEWLKEFHAYVNDVQTGRGDHLPNLSIVRLPNDHTEGVTVNLPTAQFYVAENDYALGLLVEAVSASPYWRDTAIFVVEDDAQDGPDHVDAHRSTAFVISAYNRPGALVHTFQNTVSVIRTIELILNLPPMNQLDATAAPIQIFRDEPDLRPFKATLPDVALDNLLTPPARDAQTAYWMRRTAEQDLTHADQADWRVLDQAIWFSVRGAAVPMPAISRLPAYDAMTPRQDEGEAREAEELVEVAHTRH